ncbi:MAG: patatin-like phospholipase family protein [Bacteroidales bacterium]|jgi:predicted acylesterase/phospholipase RssA
MNGDWEMIESLKNKIVVVASGGGLRALESHAGYLNSMKKHGINWDVGYGSSGGAAVLAFDRLLPDLLQFYKENDASKAMKRNFFLKMMLGWPVFNNDGFYDLIKQSFGDRKELKDVYVTMSNQDTMETYYAKASLASVIASTSMPEVFVPRSFSGNVFTKENVYEFGQPIISKRTVKYVSGLFTDGGVFDNIPVPEMRYVQECKHLFVLVCPDDKPGEIVRHMNRIQRIAKAMNDTMAREYSQIVNDFGDMENVTIVRSPACSSGLLEWSPGFGLFSEAESHMDGILDNADFLKSILS